MTGLKGVALVAAVTLFGLAACGKKGDEASPDAAGVDSAAVQKTVVTTLHSGMTKDEVKSKLGEPRTRVTMDGGLERWTYYAYDANGQIAAKTMIIFDSDGKVAEVNDQSR